MTTAAIEPMTTSQWMHVVSPELVLVDPRLADQARALLREVLDSRAFPDTGLVKEDAAAAQARQRLLEAGVDSDVIACLVPSGRRFRSLTALVATSSTAAAGAIVVLQGFLGQGTR